MKSAVKDYRINNNNTQNQGYGTLQCIVDFFGHQKLVFGNVRNNKTKETFNDVIEDITDIQNAYNNPPSAENTIQVTSGNNDCALSITERFIIMRCIHQNGKKDNFYMIKIRGIIFAHFQTTPNNNCSVQIASNENNMNKTLRFFIDDENFKKLNRGLTNAGITIKETKPLSTKPPSTFLNNIAQ